MKNNEYTLDELILKYIDLKAYKKSDNEYTLDELIYMRNEITKFVHSVSQCNDNHKVVNEEIIDASCRYLNRLDGIIIEKMCEDNKNYNFANYGLHEVEEK